MIRIDGRPIVTAEEMRAAEAQAIAGGTTVDGLMARAGGAVAEQVRRLAAGAEVLVVCGPGNNGGDGYVVAAALKRAGHAVRVSSFGEPRTAAAGAARTRWTGDVEPLAEARPAPVLVDALFGVGLTRELDESAAAPLRRLIEGARLSIGWTCRAGCRAMTARASPTCRRSI